MKNDAPVIVEERSALEFSGKISVAKSNGEPDLDMMEIEEAKRHFEEQSDLETFWAGRLLADRKTTRIAA